MSKKTAAELRAENRLLRLFSTTQAITSTLNTLIRWVGLGWLGWCAYLSVSVLAGKTTLADVGVKVLADVRFSEAAAWVFGASGVGYGLRQRKLRGDTTARQQGRIRKLEATVDPGRSSSDLTPRGQTRDEDLV